MKTSILGNVAQALGIQPHENRLFLLLIGQAFFLGMMMALFYSAANALFLAEFGSTKFPYVYIVSAITVTLVGITFAYLERRLPFAVLLIGTLSLLMIFTLLIWAGIWFYHTSWLIFASMVWMRLLWTVGNLILWSLLGRLFNVRQGKRLFPLILLGSIVAFIIVGLLTSSLIKLVTVVHLLFLAGLALIPALILQIVTLRDYNPTVAINPSTDEVARSGKVSPQLLRNRYVVIFLIFAAFTTLGTYLLDFAMVTQAGSRFPDQEMLGTFFGNYLGVSTIILLLIAVVSGKLFERFGIKVGLLLNPLVVGLCVLLTIIVSLIWKDSPALFWLTVGAKLSDDVLILVGSTARNLLYQPLPPDQRVTVQTMVESVITPVFVGITGVILLIFQSLNNFSLSIVYYTLLILLISWFGLGVLLNREYRVAIRNALQRRQLDQPSSDIPVSPEMISTLQEGLDDPNPMVVLFSMEMVAEHSPESLALPRLIKHPVPEVREKSLELMERSGHTQGIRDHLMTEPQPYLTGKMLRLLGASGDTDAVSPFLNVQNLEMRRGAITGLLQSGGLTDILASGQKLLEMQKSPLPEERVAVAEILADVGQSKFYDPLVPLLDDDDVQVQRAAIQAAGQLKSTALLDLLVEKLKSPSMAGAAAAALMNSGKEIVPRLESYFVAGQSSAVLVQIARVLGSVRSGEANRVLLRQLAHPDESARTEILHALHDGGYHAENVEVAQIKKQTFAEISDAAWLMAGIVDLNDAGEAITVFREILGEHIYRVQQRVLFLLSYLYDVKESQRVYRSGDSGDVSDEEKAYALELLDTSISDDLKKAVLPLFDDVPMDQRLQRLSAIFPQGSLLPRERLIELNAAPYGKLNEWAITYIRYLLQKIYPATDGHPPQATQEVELKMLSTIERVLFLKRIDIFAHIPSQSIARIAQITQEINVAVGQTFIKQGQSGDSLYIIVSGSVDVVLENGTKVATKQAESVIGEISVFTNSNRTANVIANTEVTALKIEQQYLRELMIGHPEIALDIIQLLARRLEESNSQIGVNV